jgi:hypothetical protein
LRFFSPIQSVVKFVRRGSRCDDTLHPPITASVKLTYTLRHIRHGNATYEDKDDEIDERTTELDPKSIALIPGAEVSPRTYSISAASDLTLAAERPEAVGHAFMCGIWSPDRAPDWRSPTAIGSPSDEPLGFVFRENRVACSAATTTR